MLTVWHASDETQPTTARQPDLRGHITVLAVDHNPILLEGIAVLINSQPDMELIGTANSAGAAIELYRKSSPDVTVIDLELPRSTSISAINEILSTEPNAKLIGLTTAEFDRAAQQALAAGVMAVVAKDRLGDMLVPLIRYRVR
jgi:DNA-binding NarL/FixJ family response regulator